MPTLLRRGRRPEPPPAGPHEAEVRVDRGTSSRLGRTPPSRDLELPSPSPPIRSTTSAWLQSTRDKDDGVGGQTSPTTAFPTVNSCTHTSGPDPGRTDQSDLRSNAGRCGCHGSVVASVVRRERRLPKSPPPPWNSHFASGLARAQASICGKTSAVRRHPSRRSAPGRQAAPPDTS